jgi:hypothetical protein
LPSGIVAENKKTCAKEGNPGSVFSMNMLDLDQDRTWKCDDGIPSPTDESNETPGVFGIEMMRSARHFGTYS